jgi:hypothetical protein
MYGNPTTPMAVPAAAVRNRRRLTFWFMLIPAAFFHLDGIELIRSMGILPTSHRAILAL